MRCIVNGDQLELTEGSTVRDLLQELTGHRLDSHGRADDGESVGLAVALDSRVVPRSSWSLTAVLDGAQIEVVEAVQGG